MSTYGSLNEVQGAFLDCRACRLHRFRRSSIRGWGAPDPLVMFVLDRLDPDEVGGRPGTFMQGEQRDVANVLLSYIGHAVDEFYYTPATACPPRAPYELAEEVPLAKKEEVAACSARVLAEVHVLQPRVVVACGQQAVRALLPKKAPNLVTSVGSFVEAFVPGRYVSYPIPVMLTNSLQVLAKLPTDEQAGLWHATCQHFLTAINRAEELRKLEE